MSEDTFGFGGGSDLLGVNVKKFKAAKDGRYRMSFCWWPTVNGMPDLNAESPRFTGARRIYLQGVGYIRHTGPEFDQFGQAARAYVATVITLWPLDRSGKVDIAKLQPGQSTEEVQVLPWIFAKDKFEQLKNRHAEFHFGTNDLTVTCTDEQYQKMDMMPAKESLLRLFVEKPDKNKALLDSIVSRTNSIADGLLDQIGRTMTVAQVQAKLNGTSAAPGGAAGARGGSSNASNMGAQDLDELLG